MKTKIIGIVAALFMLCSLNVSAQLNSFTVKGVATFQSDSLSAGGDTLSLLKCTIKLSDTLTIDQINLKVGTSLHADDALNASIGFDDPQSLPPGMLYERKGMVIYLTLGYYLPAIYYLDVYLTDAFGSVSQTKSARL